MKVAMIGAGGWGTAMMISLAARHDDLFMYCRNPQTAQEIQKSRENTNYLPGCRIPLHVKITSSLETAVKGAGCVILCTPSHAVEAMAESLVPWLEKDTVVVCASKGLADHAGHRLSEVIKDKVKDITKKIVVLSGPNHAEEVGRGLPCATVAASEVPEAVQVVQDLFMSPVFRVYRSDDIKGVEYGGALKNIMALACGVLDGIGLGDNSRAGRNDPLRRTFRRTDDDLLRPFRDGRSRLHLHICPQPQSHCRYDDGRRQDSEGDHGRHEHDRGRDPHSSSGA